MIKALTLLLALTEPSMTELEQAIWQVESSQCEGACPAGAGGAAIGPLQIHHAAWLDVKRGSEQYEDCQRLDYSVKVFRRYMKRYATEKRLGYKPDDQPQRWQEDAARIWNGGPNGFRKRKSTEPYWIKVRHEIIRGWM